MKLASEKQINLIKSLINKKEGSEEIEENFKTTFQSYIDSEGFVQYGYIIDSKVASQLIDQLFSLKDRAIRPATEKQIYFLEEKYQKVIKKGNQKAKEILAKYNLLDSLKIGQLDFATASKVISEFCN